SVVSTVRFTHSSCTKSRGFGSDAGSIPAAGAPIPLTAMPVTGSNEVIAKFAGHPRLNVWVEATVSNCVRNRPTWTGLEGIARGAAKLAVARPVRGALEVMGPAPERANVRARLTR